PTVAGRGRPSVPPRRSSDLPFVGDRHDLTGASLDHGAGAVPRGGNHLGIDTQGDDGVALVDHGLGNLDVAQAHEGKFHGMAGLLDRKSTRLNSSHVKISYAV